MSFVFSGRSLRRALAFIFLSSVCAFATLFGSVRGVIHDPQHRPVQGAKVVLRSTSSDWKQESLTNENGAFLFTTVPAGMYEVSTAAEGFNPQSQQIQVNSGTGSELHFQFAVASVKQQVEVSAAPELVNPASSTTESLISRSEIANAPGADRSNSLAMITNYVPGSYMVHDQLHVRGGHQTSWLVDGVPVPNTNIASNVGPQFDPKDIDYLEVQRGGYSAEYGDRAYGTFNVIPRSGFERNNEGELVTSYGSYNTTDDQLSLGSHTERFAYFGSLSGNFSDLGLETPVAKTLHDQAWGLGGFGNIIYNLTPADQLRVVGSSRGDEYEIPNTPEQQAEGIRDHQSERDSFLNLTWAHTAKNGVLFTLSPFYHFNSANFYGGPNDTPISTTDQRASNYFGGQGAVAITRGRHNARLGFIALGEHENHRFGLTANDGSGDSLRQRNALGGNIETVFLEDGFKAAEWLTINGGVRLTHFGGLINENSADPRIGAAIRIPKVGAVLRGFYGRYYQPPPIETLSGPLLGLAALDGVGFLPLRGERDEQWEIGLGIPIKGWAIDGAYFHTFAKNYFDHDALENSNIFFPLTIDRGRIRGWEATLRSPQVLGRLGAHLAYSHQYAEGRGGLTGGLTDFAPPEDGDYFFLDHDQRDTLNFGVDVKIPKNTWVSSNVLYGSGFLQGDGPAHFPGHTTLDLAIGKNFGESWGLKLAATNVTDNRYQLDESNTFGGTHFYDARRVVLQLKYKFHY
ncbi:MAG: TonB-dependent receptor domain-containing protein [Terriglobales bacterium]